MPRDYEKPSVLDIAVLKDDPALVQFILDAGADPNASHGCFGSALHIACCSEKENQYEMIQMLLEYGADVNLGGYDQDGRALKSPLVEFLRHKDENVSPSLQSRNRIQILATGSTNIGTSFIVWRRDRVEAEPTRPSRSDSKRYPLVGEMSTARNPSFVDD